MFAAEDMFRSFQPHRNNSIVIVTGTGGRHWRDISTNEKRDVPLGGAMGQTTSAALGLALAQPNEKVVLFDSEGSLLMNMGILATIAGQKPVITRAKKSVAAFKLREGQAIGCKVTLRGDRMYEFLDRLISLAIPRIRDFRGLSPRSFDGNGNYTFGVTEQLMFLEIDYDSVDATRGMDITIVTTAKTDAAGKELLAAFGFPFRNEGQ